MKGSNEGVYCVAYLPDGQKTLAGYGPGELQLSDFINCNSASVWTVHNGSVGRVDFSPNGYWMVSSSNDFFGGDHSVMLWNADRGDLTLHLQGMLTGLSRRDFLLMAR